VVDKWHWGGRVMSAFASLTNSHSTNCSIFINHCIIQRCMVLILTGSLNSQLKERTNNNNTVPSLSPPKALGKWTIWEVRLSLHWKFRFKDEDNRLLWNIGSCLWSYIIIQPRSPKSKT
jgi:hypothetical protein